MREDKKDNASIRISTLGPFLVECRRGDDMWERVEPGLWNKYPYARLLLQRLLCSSRRRVERSTLIEDLWPAATSDAVERYPQDAAYALRHKILGMPELVTLYGNQSGYQLAPQHQMWVDSDACLDLLDQAEQAGSTSPEALPFLEQAATLFAHGGFLEGQTGQWAYGKRATLERAQYRGRLWLAQAYERQGMVGRAESQYHLLMEDNPDDEDLVYRFLEFLHRQGMNQQMHQWYEATKKRFQERDLLLSSEFEASVLRLLQIPLQSTSSLSLHPSHHTLSFPETVVSPLTMNRRETIGSIGAFGMSLLAAPSGVPTTSFQDPLSSLNESLNGDIIAPEMLQHFVPFTAICRRLSEGNELQLAERLLWSYLPRIELTAHLSPAHSTLPATLASQGYLLAASLVGHQNKLLERLRYSEMARWYGEQAGDFNLQVVALRQLAISYDCFRRPEKVLETYERTRQYQGKISPLLQACISADLAGAHAQLGDQQEADRFIAQAYEQFPASIEHEPDYLQTICRFSSILFWDAYNQLLLQKPREAEKRFAKIDGLRTRGQGPERNRIEILNYQIETFIALHKMEQACFYLEHATKAARAIGSERRYRETVALFQQMQSLWPSEARVRQLADLFAL